MTTYSKETALYDTGAIKNGIDEAATTADNYLTDVTGGGVMVHPSDDSTTGWKISSALELLKSGVSYIWAGLVNSIATVRIGKESGGHSVIDENGMRVYGDSNGNTQLANIGYGDGTSSGSSVIKGPYYTFGQRTNNWTVGNYSVAMGTYAIADGYCAVANGSGARASGYWSHASGLNTIASMYAQTVVGSSNIADTEPDIALHPTGDKKYGHYAFIVGNGKDSERSNALTVDWNGNIECNNLSVPKQLTNPTITKTSGNSTAQVREFWGYGKMRTLTCSLSTTASISAGSNAFVGTISAGARPATYAYGSGYLGSSGILATLTAEGTLTVRIISATLASGSVPWFGFTYFVE